MRAEQVFVRRIGIGLAVAVALLTSACAAGQKAQSANVHESIDGTSVHVGEITLGGLAIETPKSVSYPAGSNVPVRVVIVNSGEKSDKLTGITSTSFSGWGTFDSSADADAAQAAPSSGAAPAPKAHTSISIAAGERASFGVPDSKKVLLLARSKTVLYPGTTVSLTFTFSNAGSVTVEVPIQLSNSPQTSIIPGPSATGEQG